MGGKRKVISIMLLHIKLRL